MPNQELATKQDLQGLAWKKDLEKFIESLRDEIKPLLDAIAKELAEYRAKNKT